MDLGYGTGGNNPQSLDNKGPETEPLSLLELLAGVQ